MRLSFALGRQSIGDFCGCVHPWLRYAVVRVIKERMERSRVVVRADWEEWIGDMVVDTAVKVQRQ